MPLLPSLPADANIGRVYAEDPAFYMPLVEFSENVLRGPSPLSPRERELIAAYVSALNACQFCTGAHTAAAVALGVREDVIDALVANVDEAPVDEKLKPVFHFVRKLTLTPSRMVQADADAVLGAGWNEQALSHVVNVCALFSYFNRLVDGHGLAPDPALDTERGAKLASLGYLGMHGPMLEKLMAEGARHGRHGGKGESV